MWFKSIIILGCVLVLWVGPCFSQQTQAKPDSTKLYRDIEKYSNKSKFNKLLYKLIFKQTAKIGKTIAGKKKTSKKPIQKPYKDFNGKTIRNIYVTTLDPFGYSISDTSIVPGNFLTRTGNQLHVKSQHLTIRNLLLIRPGQVFDSMRVNESERLVRSRGYVRDVTFLVTSTAKNADSVDIYIRELDNWSIIPIVIASTSTFNTRLTDRNFLGLGHEYQNALKWNAGLGKFAFSTNYYVSNIKNTFINSTLHYEKDEHRNYSRSFTIDRPFFSPLAKWAAGVSFMQQFREDSIRNADSLFVLQRFKFNSQDFWIGHAVQIFKGNSEYHRATNFISSVRYLRVKYLENPPELIDTLRLYTNEDFYLASIGISSRKYVQDKYIFKYGITEDVPIGKVYSLTVGYQEKNRIGRLYLGSKISFGNYYPWGYLSTSFEYGSFFLASRAQQGEFTASIIYFSGLLELGKWKFRQFIKPQLSLGFNRFPYDSLTLNDGHGLEGFYSSSVSGTKRALLTLQTQFYAPWSWIGFRFGPYLLYSLGMLSDEKKGFKASKLYSQIGAGVLIKNENLIVSTFQISFSFYPVIPGKGRNIFKVNTFNTGDFGFRDFEIGKPSPVVFQ